MSTKSYNPFSPIGRYNLKNLIYENKQTFIALSVVMIIIFIFAAYNVYGWNYNPTVLNIYRPTLPPQYGEGPYGYGLYAPPKEYLDIQ